ncbi:hypothetical protein [Cohnella fermenti]|uniref:Uncharacterized protein n=1 Tax=Cohnella fermenti TaxID=2565925 RepID=A0A4S4BTR4_9BACL|nr:hypothetical protein [Cohnella fermenti]THF78466.1 hypothetical protein E6C55_14770 [Cohnella fermenti]
MKKLNNNHLNSLLLYLHKDIHESVDWTFESLRNDKLQQMISYPPDVELTKHEVNNLIELLDQNLEIEKTMKKLMRNMSMYPLFNLFNFIDGTTDIPDSNYERIELVECSHEEAEKLEDREDFMHDLLFASYWEWKDKGKR